jgi:hypothetical protein
MNPHWLGYKALMRGDGVFTDSAIAAIRFDIKLSAWMNFIQKHQILGKVSAWYRESSINKRSSTCSDPPLD